MRCRDLNSTSWAFSDETQLASADIPQLNQLESDSIRVNVIHKDLDFREFTRGEIGRSPWWFPG